MDEDKILSVGQVPRRPPLGIKPPYIYAEQCRLRRIADLADAVYRYMVDHYPVPQAWLNEYVALLAQAPTEDLQQRSFNEQHGSQP